MKTAKRKPRNVVWYLRIDPLRSRTIAQHLKARFLKRNEFFAQAALEKIQREQAA